MLRRASAISDAAIAEMARCKGDAHLEAIGARKDLNERVSGILARRGGERVLAALVHNKTARFTAEGRHVLERRLKREAGAALRCERRQIRGALGRSPA